MTVEEQILEHPPPSVEALEERLDKLMVYALVEIIGNGTLESVTEYLDSLEGSDLEKSEFLVMAKKYLLDPFRGRRI